MIKTIGNWNKANEAYKDTVKLLEQEGHTDKVHKGFRDVLDFVKEMEQKKSIEHSNRLIRLLVLLNKCIVISELPTGSKAASSASGEEAGQDTDFKAEHNSLFDEVAKLNRLLFGKSYDIEKAKIQYHNLTYKVYWYAGVLNYRLHNFDEAIVCLSKAKEILPSSNKDKFCVYALLAYAYEFSGEPSKAIELLLGKESPILKFLFCCKSANVTGSSEDKSKCDGVCSCCSGEIKEACPKESYIFSQIEEMFCSTDTKSIKEQVFDKVNKEVLTFGKSFINDANNSSFKNQNDEIVEVIHILSHSISEYVSKCLRRISCNTDPQCVHNFKVKMQLHRIANSLIGALDNYPFICCKAMIKVESEFVNEGILLLGQEVAIPLKDDGTERDEKEKKAFRAEHAFFRWYFEQLFNHGIDDANSKIFKEYAESDEVKGVDSDASMYCALMELREKIRVYRLDEFYGKTNEDGSENEKFSDLEKAYQKLLQNPCSERVNKEMREQYYKFKALAETLLKYGDGKDAKEIQLMNFVAPFVKSYSSADLKELIENSYIFDKFYFLFPVRYTDSLEYQMADLNELLEDEFSLISELSSNIDFNIDATGLNSYFQILDAKIDANGVLDKTKLLLYYSGGLCYRFEKDESGQFTHQKGFHMESEIWKYLCDEGEIEVILSLFQVKFCSGLKKGKFTNQRDTVAIVIYENTTNLSMSITNFNITIRDEDEVSQNIIGQQGTGETTQKMSDGGNALSGLAGVKK